MTSAAQERQRSGVRDITEVVFPFSREGNREKRNRRWTRSHVVSTWTSEFSASFDRSEVASHSFLSSTPHFSKVLARHEHNQSNLFVHSKVTDPQQHVRSIADKPAMSACPSPQSFPTINTRDLQWSDRVNHQHSVGSGHSYVCGRRRRHSSSPKYGFISPPESQGYGCLIAAIKQAITGDADMYVDDTTGCSPKSHLEKDMAIADSVMRALLGPTSVADKDEAGVRINWLGWDVDLTTRTVTVGESNLSKTIHAFFCFQLTDPISAAHITRMASLASRISQLHDYLRPFTLALYHEETLFPFGQKFVRRRLSTAAKGDVMMWRCFLLILHAHPVHLARPIASFRHSIPTLKLEYDASLTGLAAGISLITAHGDTLLAFAAITLPFPTSTDSSYQNSYEYLAVLTGLLLARHAGFTRFTYSLYGDSVSSLQWTHHRRASSDLARRANIGMALVS